MSDHLTIWTYDWVPQGPRGHVRDIRLRWACAEAGLPYSIATVRFEDRTGPDHLDRQRTVPDFDHVVTKRRQRLRNAVAD